LSDNDDGWEQQKARKKRTQQRIRRSQSVPKRVAEFRKKYMGGAFEARCTAETGLPLLALSTAIHIRAWELRYTSCLLTNFESMGCDTDDLAACPIFQKISTSIPGLTPPNAAWAVKQSNGSAVVTLFIREDSHVLDLVPKLNHKVLLLFPGTKPQISARSGFHETDARGRFMPNTPPRYIYLTERAPAVPRQQPAPLRAAAGTVASLRAAATTSPPSPGSWAAAVLQGAKRLSEVTTLNHRPKKNPKPTTTASPAGPPSTTPPQQQHQRQHPQHPTLPKQPKPSGNQAPYSPASAPSSSAATTTAPPTVDIQQTSAWKELQARSAAMEQRLTDMQASTSSMLNAMAHNLEIVSAQLDEQRRAFHTSIDRIVHQLHEQALMNASVRDALEQITQRLNLSPPAMPMPSAAGVAHQQAPQPNSGSAAVGPQAGTMSTAPLTHHPTMGSGVTYASTLRASTLTSKSSATATPAHNGEAACHE
jgi:hypothetical protein